jgi:hypothetical protein
LDGTETGHIRDAERDGGVEGEDTSIPPPNGTRPVVADLQYERE